MAIPLKRSWVKRLFVEPLLYESVIGLAALIGAIVEGVEYYKKDENIEAKVFCICAVVVFLFTLLKNLVAWRQTSKKESMHELAGCLFTLHAALAPDPASRVRITILVPVKGDQELEQLMDYVGDHEGDATAGRRFASQSGVAGVAFRKCEAICAKRVEDDYEKYIKELVNSWHYTDADARKCNPATMSWLAIPIPKPPDNSRAICVVFFDSPKRDFFTDHRQHIAMAAVAGIARFISRRYSD